MMALEYVMKQITFDPTGQADEETYRAQVVNGESFGSDDLVDYVSRTNSGVSRPELASIEAAFEDAFGYFLSQGKNFHSGVFRLLLSIRGRYKKGERPASKNVRVNAYAAAALQKAAANVELKHGAEALKWAIERVHDVTTGQSNGAITIGRNIRIEGRGLELVGDDAAVEFVSVLEPTVAAPAGRLAVNRPSLLVLNVPEDLAPGTYRIQVTTRYTGYRPIHYPHTISYDMDLTAQNDV
ncbi:MAG: DUF4469 domain-containing protein [Spirochaetaceae bacterium]|jgi:hypothetical protein|nr:DUF4469 domain-containing protein [Spirochaetaceae bacterium]